MSKLLKSDLPAFKDWLSHQGIRFIEGKGEFKVLSVMTSTGSHHLFEKPNTHDYYVVTKYLAPLLRGFLHYQDGEKQKTPQAIQATDSGSEQASFKEAA